MSTVMQTSSPAGSPVSPAAAPTGTIHIGFATSHDCTNTASGFSAINAVGYYMGKSLQTLQSRVSYFGPLAERFEYYFKAKQVWRSKVSKIGYNRHREPTLVRGYSRQIDRLADEANVDVIVSSVSRGSQPVAFAKTKKPVVIWTDSALASAVDFYPDLRWSVQDRRNLQDGLNNERAALDRCDLLIYSSQWARQDAVAKYKLDPAKIKVVPFGANFECNRTEADVEQLVAARPTDVCRLLFIGADWHRKGGDIALAAAEELHRMGVKVELTLVGGQPPVSGALPPYVRSLGFIHKADPQGAQRMYDLIARSHFFMLPSRADCSPHVLNEACSFGVPCLTSNVGGIPEIIRDGANGKTFAPSASPADYASFACGVMTDYRAYTAMARQTFSEYQTRLNWTTAGQRVVELLRELLDRAR